MTIERAHGRPAAGAGDFPVGGVGDADPDGAGEAGEGLERPPESTWRLTLLAMVSASASKVPAGISTVPPPMVAASLMAFWMAVVLSVRPSPTALKGEEVTRKS